MEANPDQRDKGAGEGTGTEAAREGASGGSLRCSAEPSESEALMRRPDPEGEPPASGEPNSIGTAGRIGDGVGTKLCVLTWRDLSASAHGR
jgi:hypothetical protein